MTYSDDQDRMRTVYAERDQRQRQTARVIKLWLLVNVFLLTAAASAAISYWIMTR